MGFPGGSESKESACSCRRHGFDPWVRKIPWRRKWQLSLVFLPGESHRERGLVGHSPWYRKESRTRLRNFHFFDAGCLFPPESRTSLGNTRKSQFAVEGSPSPEEKADSGNTASGFDFSSKEGFPTRAELWVPLPRFASSWSGRKQRQRPAKAGREEDNALVSHCCWFTSLELSLEGSGQDTSWPAPHGPWAEPTALRSTRPLLELEGIPREEEGGDWVLCDLSLTLKAVRLIFPSFGSLPLHALRSIHVETTQGPAGVLCLFL